MAALRSVYRPPLPYQSLSTSTSWAVDAFDREFPGDPNGRLIHTGQQLTGARFPNGRVEAVEASHFANLMTARAMVNRQTVNEYHVNLESRSGQMVKWQMGLPYEEHSRWDRMLTATFAATTLAAGIGAPAAHAATPVQRQAWANRTAIDLARTEVGQTGGAFSISPRDIAAPASRFYKPAKGVYSSYEEFQQVVRSPAARSSRTLLLETHGGGGLGIGSPEYVYTWRNNKWNRSFPKSWSLTSLPRLKADLPENFSLAVVATCNPVAVLSRGDIPVAKAIHNAKAFDLGNIPVTVHNLHEDVVFKGGRVLSRTPYHPRVRTTPAAQFIAPDVKGLGMMTSELAKRDQFDVFILAGASTDRGDPRMFDPSEAPSHGFRPTQKQIATAEERMAWGRRQVSQVGQPTAQTAVRSVTETSRQEAAMPAVRRIQIASRRAAPRPVQGTIPFTPVPGTTEGLAGEGGLLGLLGLSRRRRRPGTGAVTRVTTGASPPPPPPGVVPVSPRPIAQEAYDFTAPTRFGGSLKKTWGEAVAPVPAPAARPTARPAVRDIPQWRPPVDNRLEELIARNHRDLDRMGRGFTEAAQGIGKVRSNLLDLKIDGAKAQLARARAGMSRIEARLDRLGSALDARGIPAASPAVLHSPVSPAIEATRPEPGVQSIAQETVRAEAKGVGAAAQVEKAAASVEEEAGLHPAIIGGGIAAAVVGGLLIAHHMLSGRTVHQRHQNLESKSGKKLKRQMNLPYQEQSRVDPMASATQALKSFGFGKLLGGSKQGTDLSAEIMHGVRVFRGADPNGAFQGQTVTRLAEAEIWAHGAPRGGQGWHLLGAGKTAQPTADVVRRLIQQEKVGSVLIDSCNPGRSFLPATPGARVTYGLGYGVASSQERQGIGAVRSWLDAVVVGEGDTSRIYAKSAIQAELERRGLDPRGLPTHKLRTVKGDFLEGDTSTLGIFQTAAGEARLTAHPIGQTSEEVMKYSLALHEAPHIKMSHSGGTPVFETGGQRFHTFEEASSSLTRSIRAQTRSAAGANRLLQGAGLKAEEAATKSFSMGNLFRLRMLSPVRAAKQMVSRVTLNAHHVNLESRVGKFLKWAMRLPFKAHSQVDPIAAAHQEYLTGYESRRQTALAEAQRQTSAFEKARSTVEQVEEVGRKVMADFREAELGVLERTAPGFTREFAEERVGRLIGPNDPRHATILGKAGTKLGTRPITTAADLHAAAKAPASVAGARGATAGPARQIHGRFTRRGTPGQRRGHLGWSGRASGAAQEAQRLSEYLARPENVSRFHPNIARRLHDVAETVNPEIYGLIGSGAEALAFEMPNKRVLKVLAAAPRAEHGARQIDVPLLERGQIEGRGGTTTYYQVQEKAEQVFDQNWLWNKDPRYRFGNRAHARRGQKLAREWWNRVEGQGYIPLDASERQIGWVNGELKVYDYGSIEAGANTGPLRDLPPMRTHKVSGVGSAPVTTSADIHAAARAPTSAAGGLSNEEWDRVRGANRAARRKEVSARWEARKQKRAVGRTTARSTPTQAATFRAGPAGEAPRMPAASQVTANVENEAKAAFHGPVLAGILVVGALVAGGLYLSHHHHPASDSYSGNRHPAPEPPTKKHEKQEIETRTERREIGSPRSNTKIRLTDADLNMETVDEIFSNHFKRGYAYS